MHIIFVRNLTCRALSLSLSDSQAHQAPLLEGKGHQLELRRVTFLERFLPPSQDRSTRRHRSRPFRRPRQWHGRPGGGRRAAPKKRKEGSRRAVAVSGSALSTSLLFLQDEHRTSDGHEEDFGCQPQVLTDPGMRHHTVMQEPHGGCVDVWVD